MLHLTCPHCHSALDVAEKGVAEKLSCSTCGFQFYLESAGTTVLDLPGPQRRFGRFEVLGVLGTGAFGTVYKARDPKLDRLVALKVPRQEHLADGQDLERFLREARSVAQLDHPAIVHLYEVGEEDGLPFLVSEFAPGVTLADYLTGRRPTIEEAARLGAALADALQYAHSQGVVHRDVKPSNILLQAGGSNDNVARARSASEGPASLPTVRLMDFGLAKRSAGEITMTLEGQVLGTPAYMSPEQARGEGHTVDGRSDLYSVGVILYELLTGELPFRGNTPMLLHQVLHEEPQPPRRRNPRVPPDLETICLKAMDKDLSCRYASATELAADLRHFLAGESIRARPPSSIELLGRWSRRPERLRDAAVYAVFLGAIFLVWTLGESLALVLGALQPERPLGAWAIVGIDLVIAVLCLCIHRGVRRNRPAAVASGFLLAVSTFAFTAAVLLGWGFDAGGLLKDPLVRFPLFGLFATLALVAIFIFGMALVASSAQRRG